jgi:steroid 5-alpha reductase family enzyme
MVVILVAALAAALAMTIAWATVRLIGDGGWTDVVWTFATGLIAAGAALAPAEGAVEARQWIAAGLVVAWSLRLGGHLATRTWKARRPDPRYERLKTQWGGWGLKAWGFLMIQAATIVALVVSVHVAAIRPDAPVGWREALAAVLLLVAVVGEGVADRQMADFRGVAANHGRVADTGLWAWSRHPNYFFEWLAWLAWPLIAIDGSAAGWLSLLAPAMMWWLLNHVSGVPPLEAEMLRTRPDDYRAYQRRVSRFFPRPPRRTQPE